MYDGRGSAEGVNNPFSTPANSRYPDISGSGSSTPDPQQYASWMQPGSQGQSQSLPMSPPLTGGTNYQMGYDPSAAYSSRPVYSQATGFTPTSNFGQSLASQYGSGYGYLSGQQSPSARNAYNPAQDQLATNSNYAPEFDPYSGLGQWGGESQQQQQHFGPGANTPTSPSTSLSASGHQHPREWIRTHKTELEAWDTYAWKQLLGSFDNLKEAWQTRKMQVDGRLSQMQGQIQYSYSYPQIQQEASRLQRLAKEAENNADAIAASVFQMHEVFSSYRQSGDASSKRRVREACNAALSSLPDWPPQSF